MANDDFEKYDLQMMCTVENSNQHNESNASSSTRSEVFSDT